MDVVCEQTLKTLSFLQQCLSQQLNYLGQNDCKSTLWTANRGDTSISAVEVRETDAEIVLQAKIPYVVAETLCIQAMPETLCLMGACQVASQISADLFDLKDTVGLPQFQHVIPLPVLIDPNTAIAEIDGDTVTVRLQKSGQSRRPVAVKIRDRWKLPTEIVFAEFAVR
jgi:HSP20 family molecular chaperone IbpA